MGFVTALMLTAEFLLIHFRIQAEKEENGRATHSLQLIGMTDQEIVKCLKYKNILRFIPPVILGTIFAFLPACGLDRTYGSGRNDIIIKTVFGIILAAAELISLERYSKKEWRGMKDGC